MKRQSLVPLLLIAFIGLSGAAYCQETPQGFNSPYNPQITIVPDPQTQDMPESDLKSEQDEAFGERLAKLEKANEEASAAKKKLPSVAINGVFQADSVWFNQTDASRDAHGVIESGAAFRRARLSAKGAVVDNMNYFLQMDFGFFGRPTFTDVWAEFNDIPVLNNVRVGQWKQPFGLETVSSFRYTTMMERAGVFQAFVPFRHIGVGFYDYSEDLNRTWAASYFRTGQDQFGGSLSTEGGNGFSGRITDLLWYEGCKGEDYLHFGAGYYFNAPPNDAIRFRSIPEIFVGEFVSSGLGTSGQPTPSLANGTPFFVDTGTVTSVNSVHTFGLEGLWVRGPWSLQTEGMAAVVDPSINPTSLLSGGYGTVGYFLTGEHRPYDRKSGAVDRVIPNQNFAKGGGPGAWEVAGRWSYLDVTDESIQGGTMQNLTIGLNWYTNPYCKFAFNYIHSWSESPDFIGMGASGPTFNSARLVNNQTDAFAMRCQLDF